MSRIKRRRADMTGTLLGVLFVGLKLTGYVDWSWWWVLSPFWIGASLAIAANLFLDWAEKQEDL